MRKLVYLLYFIAANCFADQYIFKYGLGVFNNINTYSGEVAIVSAGFQAPIFNAFWYQYEGGGWVDQRNNNTNSFFASSSIGMHASTDWVYIESMHGIGFITNPDFMIGGPIEFFHDLGFGMVDRTESTIGLQLKHISNAGTAHPNIGRNFLMAKLGFTW